MAVSGSLGRCRGQGRAQERRGGSQEKDQEGDHETESLGEAEVRSLRIELNLKTRSHGEAEVRALGQKQS